MYALRAWSVRHAPALKGCYALIERALLALQPFWRRVGHHRLEPSFRAVERFSKGLLFDCRMCGHCVLSATGMSCPMNCPKGLRNGPCGGVRPDGNCEVSPEMRCVWVSAWEGAASMGGSGVAAIQALQPAVDHSLAGSSAWLRVVREAEAQRAGQTP